MAVTTGALLGGAALAGGLSLLGSGVSSWFGNKTNKENLELYKAMQKEIWAREDTAYQRAAADAQQVGINPMALAGSGGAQSSGLTPPQMTNPFASFDANGAIGSALGVIDGFNGVLTGNSQRDLLQSQIDSQNLTNAINAVENGFYKDSNGDWVYDKELVTRPKSRQQDIDYANSKSTAERNERVNVHQQKYGSNDQSHQYTVLATDIANQADRALHGVGKVVNPNGSSLKDRYLNSKYNQAMKKVDAAIATVARGAANAVSAPFKKLGNKINSSKKSNSRSATSGRML